MNIFHLTLITLISFGVSAILTFIEIPMLKNHQFKQYIREEGPQSHLKKEGTPTMGGIAIITSLIIVSLLTAGVTAELVVMIVVTVLFALIGFLDDYIKVAGKHNLGLRAWQKLVLQIAFAVGLAVYIAKFSGYGTSVWIPFADKYVDFGWFYIPFVAFVVVAMTNSVNLTDGLDGLSSGVTAIISFFFAILGVTLGQTDSTIFCAALAGVCLGFLLFNRFPAKLFMGDTGSMAIGGALASAAIMMKMEFMLVIAGFIYVLEALSVIIQVVSYKTRGKRVFKMAPIHHHFELSGMKEKNVVIMFYLIALGCCVLGYLIYSI